MAQGQRRPEGESMAQATVVPSSLPLERGDHVCVFCRGRDERDRILLPFLGDGLEVGHKCLAVLDTSEPQEILDAVGSATADDRAADQLTVLASRDVYMTERGFDMEGMLDFYAAELTGIAAHPTYPCIRTAGEMTWALRDIPGVEDLLTYESRVNQVIAEHPDTAISLCLYDVDRFDGELIVGVLRTHPKVMLGGTIVDNPFYIRPDRFLHNHS
jgi:hypothetical protein